MHAAPGSADVTVVVPGFLDGQGNYLEFCAALRDTGCTAVTFDPRGTGASPGTPADHAPSTRLADLRLLLDQHAGSGRVTLIGHSYGAWLCALLAAADPRVTDVVAIMPTRHFIWADDHDPALSARWRRHGERIFSAPDAGSGPLRSVRVPYSVVEDAGGYSLPSVLGELRQPLLFVSGESDRVVRPTDVDRLFRACGSAVKDHRTLPGVGHDYRDDDQRSSVENLVTSWLGRVPTRRAAEV